MPLLHLHLFLAVLVGVAPPERAGDKSPTDLRARQAIERSLPFLEKQGVAWMKKQQCASCHHIPVMVWALNEARNHGYRVNERALGEVVLWALAEKNHAQVFPDLPLDKKRSETDYLSPLFMALAVGSARDRDASAEKGRQRLLTHALTQQAKDGSWHANSGGRPPVHATRDVQTSWLLLALSEPTPHRDVDNPWKSQREKAAKWLAGAPPADSHQALVMRLLVQEQLGKSAKDVKPLLETLLRRQNKDGGWSQDRKMKSDAFATGLALYALSGRCERVAEEALRRALAFLVKTQQPDGSWRMTSRAAEPPPPGPARDLRPISYVGTAWATIGLVRSLSGRSTSAWLAPPATSRSHRAWPTVASTPAGSIWSVTASPAW
jgi:squalene-hopene/tetraprenyl-beta-curcumene cyclase